MDQRSAPDQSPAGEAVRTVMHPATPRLVFPTPVIVSVQSCFHGTVTVVIMTGADGGEHGCGDGTTHRRHSAATGNGRRSDVSPRSPSAVSAAFVPNSA